MVTITNQPEQRTRERADHRASAGRSMPLQRDVDGRIAGAVMDGRAP